MQYLRNIPWLVLGAGLCFALGRISVGLPTRGGGVTADAVTSSRSSALSGIAPEKSAATTCGIASANGAPTENSSRVSAETSASPDLEKQIRAVPFKVLKGIYFARQDEEMKALTTRYVAPADGNPDYKESNDGLFSKFQSLDSKPVVYVASGDWTLRTGKRLPFRAFAEFYSTDRGNNLGTSLTLSSLATKPDDLCWHAEIYFDIDGKYSSVGSSTCLAWTARREGVPFALFENHHSKRMLPYFDSIAIPLPGFRTDLDSNPEWYDSESKKWSTVPNVRWEPASKVEASRMKDDLNRALADESML